MGTDIHLYVETRNTDGTWSAARLPYRGWPGGAKYHDGCEGWDNRNYDTFAILANVRNGRGFAGVVTGDGFNVISEPRGLPDDISDTLKPDEDGSRPDGAPWLGDHSFSWLTYDEIVGFDWTQTTHRQGVVDPIEYLRYRTDGQPHSWCGSVAGRGIRHITHERMDAYVDSQRPRAALLEAIGQWSAAMHDPDRGEYRDHDKAEYEAALALYAVWNEGQKARRAAAPRDDLFAPFVPTDIDEKGASFYTTVRWEVTYADAASDFLSWLNEIVKPIADKVGGANVRLVFGFDS